MQSPTKICKAVALVAKIEDRPLSNRTSRLLRAKTPLKQESDPVEINEQGSSTIFIWDPSGPIPQLVDISEVCRILALQKSAVYNLVATGELRKPLKFGTSRRAASRWLLSDVIHFVQTLAAQRPLLSMSISGNEALALAPTPSMSRSGEPLGTPNRQFTGNVSNAGATR